MLGAGASPVAHLSVACGESHYLKGREAMNRTVFLGVSMFILGANGSSVVHAEPPESKIISLLFHSIPDDPASEVSLVVTLSLSPVASDGNTIGWSIDAVDFFKPTENDGWKRWQTGALDVLDSPDGLWWVAHADVSSPTESEFTVLPALAGLGDPEHLDDPELFFIIEATESTIIADPDAPYASRTAYCHFHFSDGEDQVEGNDEPVEIDRPEDPGAY
jgi:hypothetical protein